MSRAHGEAGAQRWHRGELDAVSASSVHTDADHDTPAAACRTTERGLAFRRRVPRSKAFALLAACIP